MKVFASGSCRLLITIDRGADRIIPIHSLSRNFQGVNFLGKFHNTSQHIQFLRFLREEIILPEHILPRFLTSFNQSACGFVCEDLSLIPTKLESIRRQFDECEWFMFEICSMKRYRHEGFEVQKQLTGEFVQTSQTDQDLYADLMTIRQLLPGKKILFQVHFRPNVIFQHEDKAIPARESIYCVVKKFCEENYDTYMNDPSPMIQKNFTGLCRDDAHFIEMGYVENFNCLYNDFLNQKKTGVET